MYIVLCFVSLHVLLSSAHSAIISKDTDSHTKMPSFLRRLSFPKPRKSPSSPTTNEKPAIADQVVDHHQQQQAQPQALTDEEPLPLSTPKTQRALLLHAARQPYQLTEEYAVPELQGEHEVLVKTQAIGLNPIDWKAPDFNFAIPELPYISGRELAGEVVIQRSNSSSRLKARDKVTYLPALYTFASSLHIFQSPTHRVFQ